MSLPTSQAYKKLAEARRDRKWNPAALAFNRRKAHLKSRYGLTPEEYQGMAEAQGSLCAICGQPETAVARGGGVKCLSIDHCHKTGVNRSLLCTKCNVLIGMARDDVSLLGKAADYLRSHADR